MPAGGLLFGLVLMVAVPFADSLVVFVLLLAATAFAVQLGTGVYDVLTRELATAGTEGTGLTVMTTVSFTESFLAPLAGGWLIAEHSWTVAFVALVAVAALAVFGALAPVPVPEPGDSADPTSGSEPGV